MKHLPEIFWTIVLMLLVFPSFTQEIDQSKIIQTSIFFGGGSWEVDEEQIAELKKMIESIDNLENYQISLYSHTDNIGSKRFNEWLSQMRSRSVVVELEKMLVNGDYIQIKDFGMENPWFDNQKWQGKVLNRRVDVIIAPIIF